MYFAKKNNILRSDLIIRFAMDRNCQSNQIFGKFKIYLNFLQIKKAFVRTFVTRFAYLHLIYIKHTVDLICEHSPSKWQDPITKKGKEGENK